MNFCFVQIIAAVSAAGPHLDKVCAHVNQLRHHLFGVSPQVREEEEKMFSLNDKCRFESRSIKV